MKNITCIISLLVILLSYGLGLAQNTDILPPNQGTFFTTHTIQFEQGIGNNPNALAITPDGRRAVVTNTASATVSIINLENNNVIATIPVGELPTDLAITPDGRKAVVANGWSNSVSIIDLENNKVIVTIPVDRSPAALAITPDGRKAVVTNEGSDTVSIIDLDTNQVIETIIVGIGPRDLAITPDGSKGLVANKDSYSITILTDIGSIVLSPENTTITELDKTQSITATVLDIAGNPVKGVPIIFTSTDPNIALVERQALTETKGMATVKITPLEKGTANIFAKYKGLMSNLATVHVAKELEIIRLPEVSGKPFSVLVTVIPDFTGCKSIARVTVLDAYGNPVPNAEVEINLSLKTRTNREGVAEVELCLGGKGVLSATVSATAGGVESEKIFFDFSTTPEPIKDITFSPSNISLTEGDPILGGKPFLLTAKVSPPQEGVRVNFFSTDPRVIQVVDRSGVTDGKGEVTVTLLPKVSGSCEIIAQAGMFVSKPIPVNVEKIMVSELKIESDKVELRGDKSSGKVMWETSSWADNIELGRTLLQNKNDDGETSIITAAVFPPQEGVEVRFTIDRPEVASVEIRAFTDANGIATARVDGISEGEATTTAHVIRAPTSNPLPVSAIGIIPPFIFGSVIEAIRRVGIDGARVSILEEPERGAITTKEGGSFLIQAIRRAQASFKVDADGYFKRVEQIDLLSKPSQVVFPLTQNKFWQKETLESPSINIKPDKVTDTSPFTMEITIHLPQGLSGVTGVRVTFNGIDITNAFINLITTRGKINTTDNSILITIPFLEGIPKGTVGELLIQVDYGGNSAIGKISFNVS